MSSGTGTSINQPYNTTIGGVMSQPYPSSVGGNTALYESGDSAISTNYAPTLSGGARRRGYKPKYSRSKGRSRSRGKGRGKGYTPKNRQKSRKKCSICQKSIIWQ